MTSVTAIDALCQLKKLNRAKTLLSHLKDNLKVSPYFAFSLVFDCLVKDGKLDDVETQWGEIFGGSVINLSDYVIYVCKWCDLEEIKRVCERVLMGSRVLGRQSYLALIGVLCRYNEGLMAKSMLHEMYCKGFRVDDVTYIVMFQCFCRSGDLDEADWVLRKMVQSGSHIDVCIYGSFMQGLCKAKKFREANKFFNKLIKRDCFRDSKVIKSLKEKRRAVFQLNCEGVIPEMMAYEIYFRSLCSGGKLDEAEMLLKKMMMKREVSQVCVYGSFIKALFRAGRDEDALKFFNVELKKGLICPNELAKFMIVELLGKGRIDDAIRNFEEFVIMGTLCKCVDLCNRLLGGLWSSRKAMEAEEHFHRMKNGSLALPNMCTYKLMICGFCDQGNLAKTLDIFEEMLSKNIPIERSICETIVTSLCSHGLLGEAYKHLDNMTTNGYMISYTVWTKMFYSLIGDGEQR